MKKTIKPLKHFRSTPCSVPFGLTKKEWEDILDQMIFAFEEYLKETYIHLQDPDERKKTCEKMDVGLELFGKYFRSLWT